MKPHDADWYAARADKQALEEYARHREPARPFQPEPLRCSAPALVAEEEPDRIAEEGQAIYAGQLADRLAEL